MGACVAASRLAMIVNSLNRLFFKAQTAQQNRFVFVHSQPWPLRLEASLLGHTRGKLNVCEGN